MKTLQIFAAATAAFLLAAGSSLLAADDSDPGAALAAAVKSAIEANDAAALKELVYWEGASDGGKSFYEKLLQTAMEIDVESVEVMPLPEGKSGPPVTLEVTHLLRITGKPGSMPARQSFPVGEKDGKLMLAAAIDGPPGME